jgi:hypothetical protein
MRLIYKFKTKIVLPPSLLSLKKKKKERRYIAIR